MDGKYLVTADMFLLCALKIVAIIIKIVVVITTIGAFLPHLIKSWVDRESLTQANLLKALILASVYRVVTCVWFEMNFAASISSVIKVIFFTHRAVWLVGIITHSTVQLGNHCLILHECTLTFSKPCTLHVVNISSHHEQH